MQKNAVLVLISHVYKQILASGLCIFRYLRNRTQKLKLKKGYSTSLSCLQCLIIACFCRSRFLKCAKCSVLLDYISALTLAVPAASVILYICTHHTHTSYTHLMFVCVHVCLFIFNNYIKVYFLTIINIGMLA